MEHKFSPTSGHEPEPYARTTETNGDHDALAETPTPETATTASGADENNDAPDDEHEYVNTETDKTRPGDLVGAGPNWVTFWSKFGLF